jgi:hypothetical protein
MSKKGLLPKTALSDNVSKGHKGNRNMSRGGKIIIIIIKL